MTKKISLREGYTKFQNDILAELIQAKLNASQMRIILVIIRFTFGFHRESYGLSVSFISNATGINKDQVKRELKILIKLRVVQVDEEATFTSSRKLKINRNFDQWLIERNVTIDISVVDKLSTTPGGGITTTPGDELATTPGGKIVTTPGGELVPQERYIKDNNKEKEINDCFEKVWSIYPNKKGKNKISYDQKKKLYSEVGEMKLIQAVLKYKKSIKGTDQKYILHGSTFFSGRYKDYLPSVEEKITIPTGKIRMVSKDMTSNYDCQNN